VVIAPTRNEEPFALVALESSAYRVPVIASRSGGFPESIIHERSGYIIEKNSPASIAEKIKLLYESPALLKQLGEGARNFMLEHFTLQKMQNKVEEVLAAE
jgi:phosphatidylinositol alpha-1,6-mannosyltransferase